MYADVKSTYTNEKIHKMDWENETHAWAPCKFYTLTTHALHLTSLWSNHHHHSKVTHRSFRHASLHFWNQLPTSLRISPIRIIHPPLSDHHL